MAHISQVIGHLQGRYSGLGRGLRVSIGTEYQI